MNKCSECLDPCTVIGDSYDIPCYIADHNSSADDINACPFCGAPLMLGDRAQRRGRCRAFRTVYSCGTELVVNYKDSRFAAVDKTSPLCRSFSIQMEDTI